MNAPFYQLDGFSYPTAMALATLLGIGFGFVLERSGFARAPVLAAQFYGRDNRILKVMFTAVATAVVGVALLSGLGLLDLATQFVDVLVDRHQLDRLRRAQHARLH